MSESVIRLIVFIGGLALFSGLEFIVPYRKRVLKRAQRWPGNLLLIFVSNTLVKLIVPGGLMIFSEYALENKIGLFNLVEMPLWLTLFLSILILDLAIYFQHVISHKVPLFWRFHRVHHGDLDLDATSALRFHPMEIIASIFYKAIWVLLLGISSQGIFIFELILNFMAMFNHSNIKLPKKVEPWLRLLIVTPQMHIVHHSVFRYESDMNYGFSLSIWDRLFRTYKKQFDSAGVIGQEGFEDPKSQRISNLLISPWRQG